MKYVFTIIGLYLAWMLFVHIPLYGIHIDTGSGQHTGYVTAVEQEGIFFKTTRVYFKTDPQSSQEDSYCVLPASKFLVTTLDDAAAKRALITLSYSSYLLTGMTECGAENEYITQISAGN